MSILDQFMAENVDVHKPVIYMDVVQYNEMLRKTTHVKVFGHWCRADLVGCHVWLYYEGCFAYLRAANYHVHIVGLAMCEEDRAWYDNQLKRARRKAERMLSQA